MGFFLAIDFSVLNKSEGTSRHILGSHKTNYKLQIAHKACPPDDMDCGKTDGFGCSQAHYKVVMLLSQNTMLLNR